MYTNANPVFNNSVFLDIICGYLNKEELLCMLRTSRLCFNAAASRIWRSLDSVKPLIMLLAPTLEFSTINRTTSVVNVTLPALSPGVFTRFNCYHNFVRKLRFSGTWPNSGGSGSATLRLQSWSTLSLHAQHAPLLPNLNRLELSGSFSNEDEVILWISTFISPSVDTLDFSSSSEARLTPLGTVAVLGLLTQRAPNLKKLSHNLRITPSEHSRAEKPATLQLVLFFACSHLQNSQHLVHLNIGGYFVDSVILFELSRLPKLVHLSIDQMSSFDENLATTFRGIQLSMESFPSLQNFQLFTRATDDIVAAWSVVPLVSNLTTVSLKYSSSIGRRVKRLYDDEVLPPILTLISASSPHIQVLTLETAIGFSQTHPINLINSPWAHTGSLPLAHLELKYFSVDADSLRNVQQIWPCLVTLKIPEQALTLQHIVHLSQLPKLKKLSAARFVGLTEEVPEMQACGSSPLQTIELGWVCDAHLKTRYIESFARFLLNLCPELQRVEYKITSEDAMEPDLELLNMYLRVLSGLVESRKRILARYGSDAAHSLLDERLSSFR
ncbi:hypothetical protein FRC12_006107 [Ceratobasidium sp. 428]|nr:hypothetical protein FRC12_006107 [Ceratobasidium sp. 428]